MNKKANAGYAVGIIVALFVWLVVMPFVTNNLIGSEQESITKEDIQQRAELTLQNISASIKEKQYINNQFGFSLKYPPTWTQHETNLEHTVVKFASEDETTRVTIKRYVNEEFSDHQKFIDFLDENTEIYVKTLDEQGLESVSFKKEKINDLNVYIFTYFETNNVFNKMTNKYDTFRFKVMTFNVIINSDVMLGINYVALPEHYDNHLEQAQSIINSFEINLHERDSKSYYNNALNFKIDYPSEWYVQEFSDELLGSGVIIKNTDELKTENVVILIQDLSQNSMTLEEYTKVSLQQAPELIDDFVLVETQDSVLGDMEADRIIYTGVQYETDLKYDSTWTLKNDAAYIITYTSALEDYSRSIKKYENILKSFEFV